MTEDYIIGKLIEYISLLEDIPINEISKDTDVVMDIGMDSLELVELMCYIEEEFKIKADGFTSGSLKISKIAQSILNNCHNSVKI